MEESAADEVALRKESVDRNVNPYKLTMIFGKSLSARRAWIEIFSRHAAKSRQTLSLSARRAWIEINFDGRRYDS